MYRLLLVDDDDITLNLVSKYLNKSGYEVIIRNNGKSGLETLKNEYNNLDLVITDIVMPDMDGVEFCRAIRADEQLKNIPILMITSMNAISDKFIGFDAGADDYLTKPFDLLELLLRVQAILKRSTNYDKNPDSKSDKILIDKESFSVVIEGREIYLTSIEFDILNYLYSSKNKPVGTEELLQKVMDYPPKTGNPETIRTHIKNIRSKIEKDPSKPVIITTMPKRGYIFNI